jgi:hypothetical protein
MRHVKEPNGASHGGMFGEDPASVTRILDRHQPAAEVGHLRAERLVPIVERRAP